MLSEVFLRHVGQARDALGAVPALEQRLDELVRAAHDAWPGIALPDDVFLRHLAAKVSAEPDPAAALGALFATDLFFACACAEGVPAAVLALEAQFMPRAGALFQRHGSLVPHRDELLQTLRAHLLVAEADAPPRIAEYSGRAPFGAWFRI